ncbi:MULTISPECIES: copper chaperone PCu(A)C [unclassified Pseudoalteromonas]|uniref:copper chaperone PCu(A)C n=1 Tax=unclassified Pseudoalteromonas TaxID=194690 RepID=UPI003014EAAF
MKASVINPLFFVAAAFIGFSSAAHQGHEHEHQQHQSQSLNVHSATVRAFLPAAPSTAGYLVIENTTSSDKVLVKATLEGVKRVEIHEHVHKEDMMRMQRVEQLTLPAGETVTFQPGGYHLMIFEPQEPLKVGESRKLTLYFADGDRIYTMAEVVALGDMFGDKSKQQPAHHSHHE